VELATARRGVLLTRDSHPTALGYAVEARVVSRALASLGLLANAAIEDPLAPFRAAQLVIPKIRVADKRGARFEVAGLPDDRVSLVLGLPGRSFFKDQALTLDWKALKEKVGIAAPAASPTAIPKDGKAYLVARIPADAKIPPGLRAVAIVERGGEFGAARIFVSPTIELPSPQK
jgi:hypothetical protein